MDKEFLVLKAIDDNCLQESNFVKYAHESKADLDETISAFLELKLIEENAPSTTNTVHGHRKVSFSNGYHTTEKGKQALKDLGLK